MIKNKIILLLFIIFCPLHCLIETITAEDSNSLMCNINWEKYLSQHDLVWHRIPYDYFEGAYAGNGLMGVILFQDKIEKNTLCFEVGRTDVYDHRTLEQIKGQNVFPRVRLPIGQLLLKPEGEVIDSKFRVDLYNAQILGEIKTTKGNIKLQCFIPPTYELIILNLTTTKGENQSKVSFRPQQGNCTRAVLRPSPNQHYIPNPPFYVKTEDDIEVITQPLLAGENNLSEWSDIHWPSQEYDKTHLRGDDYATAWKEIKMSESNRTIFLTVANRWAEKKVPTYGSDKDAITQIKNALKLNLDQVLKVHRDWWHTFYQKSFVSIPDAKKESYYWIQMYRLGSASQPNEPIIDNMGPWYKPTVWPCTWLNLNVQLSYCTAGITNHTDLEEPLYNQLDKHFEQLIQNVPQKFRNDCAAISNPTGFDDLSGSVFITDDTLIHKPMRLIVLPWFTQMYYTYCMRTLDYNRIREHLYPLMKRAFTVYYRIAHKQSDNKYHLPNMYSDEYGYAADLNLHIGFARWGFKHLIKLAKQLNEDADLIPKWQNFLDNLVDYQVDENGLMIGANLPLGHGHRHSSHLFSIYPLYDLNIDTSSSQQKKMLEQSITNFLAHKEDSCMFKFTGASSLWSALGQGDKALEALNRGMRLLPRNVQTATSNGFYSELDWQTFESPISAARCMIDMMFQSWNDKIRIFPSMPHNWKDCSFYHLKAEGGFLVSAQRNHGETQFVVIESEKAGFCNLLLDTDKKIHVISKEKIQYTQDGCLVRMFLNSNQKVIISYSEKQNDFCIDACKRIKKENNFWGENHINDNYKYSYDAVEWH